MVEIPDRSFWGWGRGSILANQATWKIKGFDNTSRNQHKVDGEGYCTEITCQQLIMIK